MITILITLISVLTMLMLSACSQSVEPTQGMGGGRGTADDDGDGIPNFEDPDFVRGTGENSGNVTKQNEGTNFVDNNGNGINDRLEDDDGDGILNGQDEDWNN